MNKLKTCLIGSIILLTLMSCEQKALVNDVYDFMNSYIQTVSKEHALEKQNITKNMSAYYYDYKNKTNANQPEFLEIGAFSDKILIVDDEYSINEIKKNVFLDEFSKAFIVSVKFTINGEIIDKKKKIYNTPIVKTVDYWIVYYKKKLYIYSDIFLKDIFILEKDLVEK